VVVRTQIYLSPSQHRALKREAKAAGISMTELVRRIVAERVEGRQPVRAHDKEAIMRFVGLGDGGAGNASEDHDRALDEALRAGDLR
jgi:hypothetical protein